MPLSGRLDQALPPRAEDVAAVELQLPLQFVDSLFMFLDGLFMEFRGLFEGGTGIAELLIKIVDLPEQLAQQVVTLLRISRP